ncbi:ABC transporter ATP-binding protein [Myxococcus sp. K15C18031901]|uniref:ABC transporter ATP-binding protein n=1 Tax=Myxococcus dinghuensis TaxID=2906761 RepID=UPI0020A835EB|nr:oligopeptide/dipeptide ABC transporter ATP-binding protein [Myxococcus dinghuensis]MCP3098581.1 ABC transporter ATP-binding protein [Myxococcus dinghuensis]
MTGAARPSGDGPLLDVRGLVVELARDSGPVRAVDGVSFSVAPGGTLGVVGESGCGKSLTALSVLRLAPEPPVRVAAGQVLFQGQDLLALPQDALRRVRGRHAAMVFQEPMTSLNPVFTVGEQIAEGVRLHLGASRSQARERAVEMLRQVGIPAPGERVDAWPHQLSGGMRQRVMIAMALACDPALLIADEPTTALDVTIQAQILELLKRLQAERGMAVMLITHDLGVVAESCDTVVVMYAGRVVEHAPVRELFARPAHPYTAGLLRSLPALARGQEEGAPGARRRLRAIPGMVPSLGRLPTGCAFRERCDRAQELCARVAPVLEPKRGAQLAACHHPVPAS